MLTFYLSMLETDEDKLTFEEIYTLYKDAALRAAFRVTKDFALAEDAVHNGYMQIIKDWEKFLQVSCDKRRSRIVIIVKNKAIDILRAAQRLKEQELYENTIVTEIDLSAFLAHKDSMAFLLNCVTKLPEIYKIVFELKYYHELSNREIESTLELNQNTVSMRLSRAKAMLRAMIGESEINGAV